MRDDCSHIESVIRSALTTAKFGKQLCVEQELPSTNDYLWDWSQRGAGHGAVCIAMSQSAGRGRQGRNWQSPSNGNLYMSLLIEPSISLSAFAAFSLVSVLIMAESLEAMTDGMYFSLKWPNDLWVEGKKISGLLLESRASSKARVVLGLGVNFCPPPSGWGDDLKHSASSLEEMGALVEPGLFVAHYLQKLEEAMCLFESSGFLPFQNAWQARSLLHGKRVIVEEGSKKEEVLVKGVDAQGLLIVESNSRERLLVAGEVHLIPGRMQ